MKSRCFNSSDKAYRNYGGRGITVCEEWLRFEPFYVWAISIGYKHGLTIERINNSKGYSPDNCTWIPKGVQSMNTRRCKIISYKEEEHNIKEWAIKLGIPYHRLQSRLKHGWDTERAFTTLFIPPSCRHVAIIQTRQR